MTKERLFSASLFNARRRGFEPPTPWSVAKCSIQLSYHRICCFYQRKIVYLKSANLSREKNKKCKIKRERPDTEPKENFNCQKAQKAGSKKMKFGYSVCSILTIIRGYQDKYYLTHLFEKKLKAAKQSDFWRKR